MGAYLAFTAEAARKHFNYCDIDSVRYGHAGKWRIDRVRHLTGTRNMTRPARLDERLDVGGRA